MGLISSFSNLFRSHLQAGRDAALFHNAAPLINLSNAALSALANSSGAKAGTPSYLHTHTHI